MEALTGVASLFAWRAYTVTDQHQLCLSPKGSGGEAYGLCHMTPIAGQPRLKACSLKTSQVQVHLALALTLRLNSLKRFTQFIHRLKTVVFFEGDIKRYAYFGSVRGFVGLLAGFPSLLWETSLSPIR